MYFNSSEIKNGNVNYIFIIHSFLILCIGILYSPFFSNLLPPLSNSMYLFLISLIVINLIFIANFKFFPVRYINKINNTEKVGLRSVRMVFLGITIGFVLTFIHAKSIPIISIVLLKDTSYVYKNFGIPFFHVLLLTFTQYYTINLWVKYLLTKDKLLIKYIFMLSCFPIVIYNRGAFLLLVSSMVFAYIFINRIRVKTVSKFIVGALIIVYIFGVSGNIRTNNLYKVEENPFKSSVIMQIGQPDNSVIRSSDYVKPFYWSYFYLVSPLGNYQLSINQTIKHRFEYNFKNQINAFLYIIPDFLSKRIIGDYNYTNMMKIPLISPTITAATAFSLAYYADGWFGVYLIVLVMYSLLILATLIKDSTNKIVGLSIASTIIFFSFFSNMLIFSGLSFQIIYCFLFGFIGFRFRKEKFKSAVN